MRGLAGCQKIQKSKNPSFQTESLDSGQKDGFLDFPRFFWIFLDSSKGCLDFWVSKSKIQKNSRKKIDFCKNPTFTCMFLDFLEKSIFFLKFFWIFDIRIGKINLFPSFFLDFCKNPSFFLVFFWNFDIRIGKIHLFPRFFFGCLQKSIFFLGFFTFFEKSIFFLEFFWIFDLETQKSKHPFEESKKIQKNLGKSKNPSF